MKTLNKLGLLFLLSLIMVSCGDGNLLDSANPFSSSSDGLSDGSGGGIGAAQSSAAAQVMQQTNCVTSTNFGNNSGKARITYGPYSIGSLGGFGYYPTTSSTSGWDGPLSKGGAGGSTTAVFVGVSHSLNNNQFGQSLALGGDVIEVHQKNNGRASVYFHICRESPLIQEGRIVNISNQSYYGYNSLLVDTQTGCQSNSSGVVNSFTVQVAVQGTNLLAGADFPIVFTNPRARIPGICFN